MHIRFRAATIRILPIVAAACVAGCTVYPNMGSFETSSPVAFNFLTGRRIESAWLARFDQVVQAVDRAAETLKLNAAEREGGPDGVRYRVRDARADQFRLVVEPRTGAVTSILIDVMDDGSVAVARLFARQIILELTEAGVFDDSDSAEESEKLFQNL
jgi:hypothetical protein